MYVCARACESLYMCACVGTLARAHVCVKYIVGYYNLFLLPIAQWIYVNVWFITIRNIIQLRESSWLYFNAMSTAQGHHGTINTAINQNTY